jgi:hypothetical protein
VPLFVKINLILSRIKKKCAGGITMDRKDVGTRPTQLFSSFIHYFNKYLWGVCYVPVCLGAIT